MYLLITPRRHIKDVLICIDTFSAIDQRLLSKITKQPLLLNWVEINREKLHFIPIKSFVLNV